MFVNYKIFIIIILFSFLNLKMYSQETETKKVLSDKVFFGGNLGLQLGTIINIEVAPLVGYKLLPKIHFGLGATYTYFRDSRIDFSTYRYGGRAFVRVFPIPIVFGHGELEMINTEKFNELTGIYTGERIWVESMLVGAGFRQQIGQRSAVNFMLLWNLNETKDSPYSNPIIRVGFNF